MRDKTKRSKDRCDRCGRLIWDGRGVYRGSAWGNEYLRPDEDFVCWDCLDDDPYYRVVNTPQPPLISAEWK